MIPEIRRRKKEMGNKLCACDEKSSEGAANPMMIQKATTKASQKAMNDRSDSMTKLMLNNQTNVPEQDKMTSAA